MFTSINVTFVLHLWQLRRLYRTKISGVFIPRIGSTFWVLWERCSDSNTNPALIIIWATLLEIC